jgi:hypothetical protein
MGYEKEHRGGANEGIASSHHARCPHPEFRDQGSQGANSCAVMTVVDDGLNQLWQTLGCLSNIPGTDYLGVIRYDRPCRGSDSSDIGV